MFLETLTTEPLLSLLAGGLFGMLVGAAVRKGIEAFVVFVASIGLGLWTLSIFDLVAIRWEIMMQTLQHSASGIRALYYTALSLQEQSIVVDSQILWRMLERRGISVVIFAGFIIGFLRG